MGVKVTLFRVLEQITKRLSSGQYDPCHVLFTVYTVFYAHCDTLNSRVDLTRPSYSNMSVVSVGFFCAKKACLGNKTKKKKTSKHSFTDTTEWKVVMHGLFHKMINDNTCHDSAIMTCALKMIHDDMCHGNGPRCWICVP